MRANFYQLLRKTNALVKRLYNSAFFVTIAAILSFSVLVEILNPLDLLFFTGLTGIRQNNMVSKLPRILKSKNNPDVLVLGSSVSLYPMGHLDDLKREGKTRWDDTYVRYKLCPYTKADYFKSLLEKSLNTPLSVTNASVVAAVVSDQYLILDKYIKSGKKPKLIVYFTAPRDFVINNNSQIGKSPTYEILADFQNLTDVIANNPDFKSITEFAFGQVIRFYNVRHDYYGVLISAASRITGRPMNQYDAKVKNGKKPINIFAVDKFWETEAIYEQPPNEKKQFDYYQKVYDPIDEVQFSKQIKYFKKLLDLAKRHQIEVCVVDTPVPHIHYNLIPKNTLARYRALLKQTCLKNEAILACPGLNSQYPLSDFEDITHLNISGASKLTHYLAGKLSKNRLVVNKLSPRNIMIGLGKDKSSKSNKPL